MKVVLVYNECMENINEKPCLKVSGSKESTIMVVICGNDDVSFLTESLKENVLLVSFSVNDWNSDFSPWPYHLNSRFDFSGNGDATLNWLMDAIEGLSADYPDIRKRIICGYSLGGLFALYAFYKTGNFDGVGSFSGSLWFEGWDDYSSKCKVRENSFAYLSVGDKEADTRNRVMATVMDKTLLQQNIFNSQNVRNVFEINTGNHFQDHELRITKGVVWLVENADGGER